MLVGFPLGPGLHAPLELAQVVGEVVGGFRHVGARPRGVAVAQIAVVGRAREVAVVHPCHVGAGRNGPAVAHGIGGQHGEGEVGVAHLGLDVSREGAFHVSAVALGHLHVVVFDGGVGLHALRLKTHADEHAPWRIVETLLHGALDGDAHGGVVAVDAAYLAGQGQGRRAAQIETRRELDVPAAQGGFQQVVDAVFGALLGPQGRHGHGGGQEQGGRAPQGVGELFHKVSSVSSSEPSPVSFHSMWSSST